MKTSYFFSESSESPYKLYFRSPYLKNHPQIWKQFLPFLKTKFVLQIVNRIFNDFENN